MDQELIQSSEENEPLYEHYQLQVDPGQESLRIDLFLIQRLPQLSRTRLQLVIESGFLTVNGTIVKASYKIKPLDQIRLFFPNPVRTFELIAENIPLDIIYEDAHLIIINKSADMVVHPGCGNYTGTLVNALLYHFDHLPNPDTIRPGLVHRIDKNTSGLLLIAKTDQVLAYLANQFQERKIERRYWALVWGNVKNDFGTIEGHIGRAEHNRKIMDVYPDGDQGKPAITHWRVLERLGYVTLVECKLETGRTHQIRVHFKSIGHPLFNDPEYGGNRILKGKSSHFYHNKVQHFFGLLKGQALHAKTLGFMHPATEAFVHFESNLPADFELLLQNWRDLILTLEK